MSLSEQIVEALLGDENEDPKDFIHRHDIQVHPRVRISYSRTKFDDDGSGNYQDEHGWVNETGEEFELDEFDREEGVTLASKIAEFLKRNGAVEPSSSHFHEGIWYTDYGETEDDGWVEQRSYHLVDIDPETQAEIFKLVNPR